MVKNFKYKPGGQQAKNIFLQAEGPANGGKGGSVYVEADERYDSLLHLHKRYHYKAKDGSNANPVTAGRGSVKRAGGNVQKGASPLVLKVPIGTTVISKRGGRRGGGGMSVELLQSGERVLVASGGEGGLGAEEPQSGGRKSKGNLAVGMSVTANKLDWQKVSNGKLGEMAQVHLVLRVKADIGLVGLPNAGKSTLLSAVTRAKPDIADYPFTTLVPNLGVIGGSATTWKEEEPIEEAEGAFEVDYDSFAADKDGFDYEESPLESAVVADLPGLIGDAHKGKGLGRVFLRHLKRTRVICHLVDIASSSDPFSDYIQIREELRMYNPEYVLDKPHVVVFTKCDLLAGEKDYDQERREFLRKTEQFYEESEGSSAMPTGIVFVSSQTGQGMEELVERVAEAFKSIDF